MSAATTEAGKEPGASARAAGYRPVPNWPNTPDGWNWGQVVQVIVDTQDRVFFFQRDSPAVSIWNTDGDLLETWPEPIGFDDIHGAYYGEDADGEYLLIIDRNANRLARTTLSGEVVWSRDDLGFNRPTDAGVASNGDIYVSDGYGNPYVHRLTSKGEPIARWGTSGVGPGQFNLVHSVWMTDYRGEETVYVCDRHNYRVQRFSLDGEYRGKATGARRPTDLVVGPDGTRYVTELDARVTLLDTDDHPIAHIGGVAQHEPGEFVSPHSIWLDSTGAFYVTEVLEGRRVQKFVREDAASQVDASRP